jgi:hypothetical protein
VIDSGSSRARKAAPFVPANGIRKPELSASTQFAARDFAAKRAGFLLREYARQQEDLGSSGATMELGAEAGAMAESFSYGEASAELFEASTEFTSIGVSSEEVERLVAEAEQRGREAGKAELVTALDHAIAALDAAGRAVSDAQADLERRSIVPLAQASFHIGSELARQVLSDAAGLQRYLEAVTSAIQPNVGEAESPASMAKLEVRLNPEDLALLERASFKPSSITLISDPLVPRAGAIASSENKVVDDRFENRVRFAKEAVLAAAADLLREAPA